jgi:hypothetical protein
MTMRRRSGTLPTAAAAAAARASAPSPPHRPPPPPRSASQNPRHSRAHSHSHIHTSSPLSHTATNNTRNRPLSRRRKTRHRGGQPTTTPSKQNKEEEEQAWRSRGASSRPETQRASSARRCRPARTGGRGPSQRRRVHAPKKLTPSRPLSLSLSPHPFSLDRKTKRNQTPTGRGRTSRALASSWCSWATAARVRWVGGLSGAERRRGREEGGGRRLLLLPPLSLSNLSEERSARHARSKAPREEPGRAQLPGPGAWLFRPETRRAARRSRASCRRRGAAPGGRRRRSPPLLLSLLTSHALTHARPSQPTPTNRQDYVRQAPHLGRVREEVRA